MAYQLNEIFYSIQGEGHRKGTANVFARFAGCNLQCNIAEHGFDCDTDFSKKLVYQSTEAVLCAANRIGWRTCRSVIFTGGEPGLQLDDALVDCFKSAGWYIAVETNGMYQLPKNVDWISCSPKRGIDRSKLVVQEVDELRLVVDADPVGMPVRMLGAKHLFLSPAHDIQTNKPRPGALANAIKFCKDSPQWRLSVQDHKAWGIR